MPVMNAERLGAQTGEVENLPPMRKRIFLKRAARSFGRSAHAPDSGVEMEFSIQAEPLALELPIRRFVRVRGGEYLFMPGLKALAYLAET